MGIAAKIADNLTSAEDALDEEVNAEIEERIDAVLPFLQVSQSYANRLAEDARRKNDDDETDDEDDNNEPQKIIVNRVQTKTIPKTTKRMMMLRHGQKGCSTKWTASPTRFLY